VQLVITRRRQPVGRVLEGERGRKQIEPAVGRGAEDEFACRRRGRARRRKPTVWVSMRVVESRGYTESVAVRGKR